MKSLFVFALLSTLATPLRAGVTYHFETVSSGLASSTMSGSVSIENGQMRLDIARGDRAVFRTGSYLLMPVGGRTLTLVDPAARTYSVISLDQLAGSAKAAIDQLRTMVDVKVVQPRVNVREIGPGVPIEGRATRRHRIDASYTLVVGSDRAKFTIPIRTTSTSWVTDSLPADYANALELQNVRIGIPEIDQLFESTTGKIPGFPLRRLTTMTITRDNKPVEISTSTNVTKIQTRSLAASLFALPQNYRKVASPIEKAIEGMKR